MADILEDAEAAIETLANGDFVQGPAFAALLRGLVAEVEALRAALDVIIVDCGFLHHAKGDRHMSTDPCPVEARVQAARKRIPDA